MSFLCLSHFQLFSPVRILSRHSALEHWKCSAGGGGNFSNDSGGLRGLSFISLVAGLASSGTQVMFHYPYYSTPAQIIGSARQSVEVRILRGSPKSNEFGLSGGQALRLE